MNWASHAIDDLSQGKEATIKPSGNSMLPHIQSKATVVLEPLGDSAPVPNDIVLCRCAGNIYLHFVRAVHGKRFVIANAKGFINGMVSRSAIYGKVKSIDGKPYRAT